MNAYQKQLYVNVMLAENRDTKKTETIVETVMHDTFGALRRAGDGCSE